VVNHVEAESGVNLSAVPHRRPVDAPPSERRVWAGSGAGTAVGARDACTGPQDSS